MHPLSSSKQPCRTMTFHILADREREERVSYYCFFEAFERRHVSFDVLSSFKYLATVSFSELLSIMNTNCRSHMFDLDLFIVCFTCGVASCGFDQWGLWWLFHLSPACKRERVRERVRERERERERKREKEREGEGELGVTFSVDHTPDCTPQMDIQHLCSPFTITGFCFFFFFFKYY